jgi:hypothetical protein
LLISPKQHSFYHLPAIPWFILAMGVYGYPRIAPLFNAWQPRHWTYKLSYLLFGLLFLTAFILTGLRAHTNSRDQTLLNELKILVVQTDFEKGVAIPQSMVRHHSLHAYLQRYYRLDLLPEDSTAAYWLCETDSLPHPAYSAKVLGLTDYELWSKAN